MKQNVQYYPNALITTLEDKPETESFEKTITNTDEEMAPTRSFGGIIKKTCPAGRSTESLKSADVGLPSNPVGPIE